MNFELSTLQPILTDQVSFSTQYLGSIGLILFQYYNKSKLNKSIQKDIRIMLDYFKIRTFPKIRKMLEKNHQNARKYALISRELGIVESSCKTKSCSQRVHDH